MGDALVTQCDAAHHSWGAVPASPITLAPNYYVGIHRVSGGKSHVILGNTLDTRVMFRRAVLEGGVYFNNGGVQANSGGPYEIQVLATP